ncbi:MAG: hypothetical protein GY702_09345 [Desulfobulbaceae bacterium]|nr:hypothetical protein [Desulfobulbaceae bacterium]
MSPQKITKETWEFNPFYVLVTVSYIKRKRRIDRIRRWQNTTSQKIFSVTNKPRCNTASGLVCYGDFYRERMVNSTNFSGHQTL